MLWVEMKRERPRLRTKAEIVEPYLWLAGAVRLHSGKVSGVRLESMDRRLRKLVRELDSGQTDVCSDIEDRADVEVRKPRADIASKVMAHSSDSVPLEVTDRASSGVSQFLKQHLRPRFRAEAVFHTENV
jgi:hypothetical protein